MNGSRKLLVTDYEEFIREVPSCSGDGRLYSKPDGRPVIALPIPKRLSPLRELTAISAGAHLTTEGRFDHDKSMTTSYTGK